MGFKVKQSRQLEESPTDRQEKISWWRRDIIENAKVLVVGAGALGNEVLKNLSLLGVGYIFVIDFDAIEISNLSRTVLFGREDLGLSKAAIAAKKTQQMNVSKNAKVDFINGDVVGELGLGVFTRVDIVLGCLDNIEARLKVNQYCIHSQTPYIDAGMLELAGSVYIFNPPFKSCFSCVTTENERESMNARYSCYDVKKRDYAAGKLATVQVTSAIIAGIQVEQAIKLLHGQIPSENVRIQYDGRNIVPYFDKTKILQRKGCDCEKINPLANEEIRETPLRSDEITLRYFIDYLETNYKISKPDVTLETFYAEVYCSNCNHSTKVLKPARRLFTDEIKCEKCGIQGDWNILSMNPLTKSDDLMNLGEGIKDDILDMCLYDLGFPYLSVIEIYSDGKKYYFELTGDQEIVMPGLNLSITK